jgi:hypothetical protein
VAKTSAARHIWLAISTIIVKPQRRMRMNQKAELIPVARYQAWYDLASTMSGLTDLDRKVLDVIAEWYRLQVWDHAGR